MNLKSPHLWIAFATGMAVVALALADSGRVAPGELSRVHAGVEELQGRGSCSSCHGGWTQSMGDACLECHLPIEEQIDGSYGLHGSLGEARAAGCAACHSEHHGPSFPIVNSRSFATAGAPDRDEFDHGLVGYDMQGKHLTLECAECHELAEVEVLPAGEVRFLGLERDCASCHEDPHEGALANDCASCHVQTSFEEHAFVEHDRVLPLIGGHAGLDCRECHAEGEPHALERLGRRGSPPARDCAACHDSPHAERFVAGVARLADALPGASCVLCHEPQHELFREEGLEVSPAEHARAGFPLGEPHAEVACADCHDPGLEEFAERYPGRGKNECAACHADPHEGQFEQGRFARKGCVACHERTHFEPPAFGVEEHARTRFELTGRHAKTECAECHDVPAEGAARRFHGTPARCERCHSDAHDGFFDERLRELGGAEEGACATCHDTQRFDRVPRKRFAHEDWTGFPVDGAHEQEGCAVCHEASSAADENGRSFGRVAEHFGEVTGCASCHTDPHQGAFDLPGLPRRFPPRRSDRKGGREGCARCHVSSSFRFVPEFDHGLWTGYPLDGRHATASCAACHTPRREPDADGRMWERAAGTSCAACHEEVHAGQFERNGATRCERCHYSATSFTYLSFDHGRDSRFPLDEAHASLECSECHQPEELGGSEVVRYRPLGRECVDCHGPNTDPLGRRRRGGR